MTATWLPPAGMAAPAQLDAIFLYIHVAILVAAVIAAMVFLRRSGSAVPLVLLAAGGLCAVNEAVVDRLGLCWFPTVNGPAVLYRVFGVSVPLFMLPVYAWYVGGQAALSYALFRRGISARGVLLLYLAFAAVNVLLEAPGLNIGIYAYFGNQPFRLFLFPCWWAIANAMMPLALASFAYRTEHLLAGWRRVALVVAAPPIALAANAATVAPVWFALQSGLSLAGADVAAIVALGLGLAVVRVLGGLVGSAGATPAIQAQTGMA